MGSTGGVRQDVLSLKLIMIIILDGRMGEKINLNEIVIPNVVLSRTS